MSGPPDRSVATSRFGPLRRLVLSGGLLLALFAALNLLFDPYEEGPSPPLEVESFEARGAGGMPAGEHWRWVEPRVSWSPRDGHGGSGGVRLEARDGRGSWIERAIGSPQRFDSLRVRARMRLVDFEPRDEGYSGARWVLFFRDEEGSPMWRYPHVVCLEREAAGGGWIGCQGTFDVPPEAAAGFVRAQIVAARGELLVDDLEITPARPRPVRFAWYGLLVVLWLATVVQGLLVVRPWQHPLGAAQLALAALIVVGTVAPAWMLQDSVELMRDAGRQLEQRWDPAAPADDPEASSAPKQAEDSPAAVPAPEPAPKRAPEPEPVPPEDDAGLTRWIGRLAGGFQQLLSGTRMVATAKQSGHAVLFFLLAVAAYLGLWRRGRASRLLSWCQTSLLLVAFAAATEMLQVIAPSRAPALQDWLLDLAGIAAGLVVCGLLYATFWRRRVRKTAASPSR
jgi:VanZ family protein